MLTRKEITLKLEVDKETKAFKKDIGRRQGRKAVSLILSSG